jgi:hypothetical protein
MLVKTKTKYRHNEVRGSTYFDANLSQHRLERTESTPRTKTEGEEDSSSSVVGHARLLYMMPNGSVLR